MNSIAASILIILCLLILYSLYIWLFGVKQTLMNETIKLTVPNPPIVKFNNSASKQYAYGFWVYLNETSTTNDNTLFSRPGNITLYIKRGTSDLYSNITKADGGVEEVQVKSNPNTPWPFPLQRWIHIIVSVNDQFVDYYINGKLTMSEKKNALLATPGDIVNETKNAGTVRTPIYLGNSNNTPFVPFNAVLTKFTRWPNAITPDEAWSEYLAGNGGVKMPYSVRLDVIKDNKTQSTYQAW